MCADHALGTMQRQATGPRLLTPHETLQTLDFLKSDTTPLSCRIEGHKTALIRATDNRGPL